MYDGLPIRIRNERNQRNEREPVLLRGAPSKSKAGFLDNDTNPPTFLLIVVLSCSHSFDAPLSGGLRRRFRASFLFIFRSSPPPDDTDRAAAPLRTKTRGEAESE